MSLMIAFTPGYSQGICAGPGRGKGGRKTATTVPAAVRAAQGHDTPALMECTPSVKNVSRAWRISNNYAAPFAPSHTNPDRPFSDRIHRRTAGAIGLHLDRVKATWQLTAGGVRVEPIHIW